MGMRDPIWENEIILKQDYGDACTIQKILKLIDIRLKLVSFMIILNAHP